MTGETTPVWVTGMGVATPLGCDLESFRTAQLAGLSGIAPVTGYDACDDPVRIAGQVRIPQELAFDRRTALRTDRCTQLATVATTSALADAGLDAGDAADPQRVGVVIGSAIGGSGTIEENYLAFHQSGLGGLRARAIPMAMINDAAASVAIRYGFSGPCTAVATACASGADAIVAGYQMIVCGEADVVVAGGAEAPVVRSIVSGFAKLGALSRRNDDPTRASRPFDRERDGFVLSEGAAVVVLESAAHAAGRGRSGYARLCGYGRSSDAHHVTMPRPDGHGAALAIERALRTAGSAPHDVGMINAHGTSTTLNDLMEAVAIRSALGALAIPVTATKSAIGHSLGAAGAIEAVATVQALHAGMVPPVVDVEGDLDPAIDLDVVCGKPRPIVAPMGLSHSFAFGGHNVVLAFSSEL